MTENTPQDLKARIKDSYDTIAHTYNEHFTRFDASSALDPMLGYLDHLITHLQSLHLNTATVLELGCGAGVPATKYLLTTESPVINLTGNDISTTQLQLAETNLASYGERLTLVEGDMLALSFSAGSFDAVTGLYSIIHLPREEQTQLMQKIVTWLKPGGVFLGNFSVQEFDSLENEKWLDHEKGWMFWSGWGEEKSVEMVEGAGLTVLAREKKQVDGDAEFVWILAKKN